MKSKLANILQELQKLQALSDDEEANHTVADNRLLKVIQLLSKETEVEGLAKQIIEAYKDVSKWYA